MQLYYLILYFFVYGVLGWCTEVGFAAFKERRFVNRGFLNGPICPIYGIGVGAVVQFLMPLKDQLIPLYIASAVLVTVLEWLTGFLLDKIFHHRWWDYSNMPLNIGGYVCLLFSLIWGVICVFIVQVFHPIVHKMLTWIPFYLGLALVIILGVVMFADLYVTASTILKFNRRLEHMEKIASDLREISDKLGENIYENVMEGVEIHDEILEGNKRILDEGRRKMKEQKEELQARREELQAKREELQAKYRELAEHRNVVSTRLMKAFPHMQSHRHKKILEELKEALENRR